MIIYWIVFISAIIIIFKLLTRNWNRKDTEDFCNDPFPHTESHFSRCWKRFFLCLIECQWEGREHVVLNRIYFLSTIKFNSQSHWGTFSISFFSARLFVFFSFKNSIGMSTFFGEWSSEKKNNGIFVPHILTWFAHLFLVAKKEKKKCVLQCCCLYIKFKTFTVVSISKCKTWILLKHFFFLVVCSTHNTTHYAHIPYPCVFIKTIVFVPNAVISKTQSRFTFNIIV